MHIMDQDGQKYRVIFMGAAVKDFGLVDKLAKNLQDHCNISSQVVTKMMRLAPITVKNGIDLQEAERYKRALEGMGAKVSIEPINGADAQAK
jgi:ribosomal protein L7/L12